MTSKLTTLAILSFLSSFAFGGPSFFLDCAHAKTRPLVQKKGNNKIQVAILLDTSSSMSGLINQTRAELWSLVNELAATERNGAPPELSIALYEYGKPSLGANTGFVKQLAPLTNDLDAVSEALFALHTNGGSEYAGHVIQDAVKNLAWDKDDASLKMVFIAGNESFSQGPTDFREAISDAAEKGIVVNTIYCGNEGSEEYAGWQEGARLARGKTMSIDHNAVVQHIASPHDAEIARLSQELNSTYIAYGRGGNEKKARQVKQDKNVASDMRVSVGRAKSKVSGQYRNSSWDLVDAASEGADIGEMEEDALPAEMQGMSKSARRDHVAKTAKKRKALARKLRTLTEKRERFVAKTRKAAPASAPTLKEGLMKVATEQAEAKGYKKK